MSKHTPGPWRWEVHPKGRTVRLVGHNAKYGYNFDLTVIDFVRWGMSQAAPRFRTDDAGLNIMKRVDEWAEVVPGREHHADWFRSISHPDASLIASAPDLLNALEDLLRAYDDGEPQCHCANSGHVAPAPCAPCKARAAIAKARGEA